MLDLSDRSLLQQLQQEKEALISRIEKERAAAEVAKEQEESAMQEQIAAALGEAEAAR